MLVLAFALVCHFGAVVSFQRRSAGTAALDAKRIHHRSISSRMVADSALADLKDRLYLYNTLTKDKQLFLAIDADKKSVSFYRYGQHISLLHVAEYLAMIEH